MQSVILLHGWYEKAGHQTTDRMLFEILQPSHVVFGVFLTYETGF